jgi:hypothetical protein
MPAYRVYVPVKYYSVFKIEADNAQDAIDKYDKGEINYDECYQYDTDTFDPIEDIEVEEYDDE